MGILIALPLGFPLKFGEPIPYGRAYVFDGSRRENRAVGLAWPYLDQADT
jgi:hypothetical protein